MAALQPIFIYNLRMNKTT